MEDLWRNDTLQAAIICGYDSQGVCCMTLYRSCSRSSLPWESRECTEVSHAGLAQTIP